MENVRISFEVPSNGGFTVKELTERARHFVMNLVNPDREELDDEELAETFTHALPYRTAEETAAELDRRWEHYLQHPESAIPHKKVMEELRALL